MSKQESQLEEQLIEKLAGLKYEIRTDIRDRAALKTNFRNKFQALKHVKLTDAEFSVRRKVIPRTSGLTRKKHAISGVVINFPDRPVLKSRKSVLEVV